MIFTISCVVFALSTLISLICAFISLMYYDPHHIHWYESFGLICAFIAAVSCAIGVIAKLVGV